MMLPLLKWGNLALILASLATLLAPYVHPEYFWPLSITGLFFPWLLLLHLAFIGFWLYQKNRYFLYSLGWLAISWNHFDSLVGVSTPDISPDGLSILSLNCHGFFAPSTGKRPTAEEWESWISANKEVDFLFFQEFPSNGRFSGAGAAVAKKEFARHWPHKYHQAGGRLAIWSKYPLSDKKVNYFSNHVNGIMQATATVNKQRIRLLNVHLQSNSITELSDEFVTDLDVPEKETLNKFVEMLRRYKNAAIQRARQVKQLEEILENSSGSLVLGGDFNDTPQSYAYQRIHSYLSDGFRQKGMGIGTTYQGKLPGLRIDYIFFSPDLFVESYRHRKTLFSDHKMVQTSFRWKE